MQEKVSICQLSPRHNYPNNNFEQIEKVVSECQDRGSSLCVFPEDFLFGIIRGKSALLKAGTEYKKWLQRFSELAAKYKIDLVPGSLPKTIGESVYNTTIYIDKNGNVLGEHYKSNLWLSERGEYDSPHKEPPVFKTILGKTSLLICWDIMNHSNFKTVVCRGAEWIIAPALWSTNQSPSLKEQRGQPKGIKRYPGLNDSNRLNNLIASRVFDYNIGIIFCNIGEKAEYINSQCQRITANSAGRSQIIGPNYCIYSIIQSRKIKTLEAVINTKYANEAIYDAEILYGRREDIVSTSARQ